jgi:hypothetical protein
VAVQTPVRPVVNPAGAPPYAAVGASDTIPVAPTGKYLLIVKNAGGSPDNMVIDDPTTPGAVGATAVQNPDVSTTIPATTGERHFELEAQRFRDVNGNINVTHSFTTTVTCIVYGPY